jgi:hypothetical protein
MSYADKVRAGIALLDEQVPDWAARIDPVLLDVQHCSWCVLGQLFGDYLDGVDSLVQVGSSSLDGTTYGFEADGFDDDNPDSVRAGYRILTRLWTYVIRKRQQIGGES